MDSSLSESSCDEELVSSVEALSLSGSVESSLSLLRDIRDQASLAVNRTAGGAVVVTKVGVTSMGITKLARSFLMDMGMNVEEDISSVLLDKLYARMDRLPALGTDRSFSEPYDASIRRKPCSYFHNLETLLSEELSHLDQICVYTEMAIGSNLLTFTGTKKELRGLPRVAKVVDGIVCLTGSVDMVLVDRTTGAISVGEVKTKNLPRFSGGYPRCPRLTRPDLLQAWFYAYVLAEIYKVPVRDLMILRTDVTKSKISTTRVPYEYADVWGAEHLALLVLKNLIKH